MERVQRIFSLLLIIGLAITFLGCDATSEKESTGQYIDDSVITTKVKTAIFEEPGLKTLQIEVETFKGVVQLSGFVDTPQNATRAGQVAGTVDGVKSVENNLVVK
jgi:osmotically-inducible protein OsmY